MWWEALPGAAICITLLAIPQTFAYFTNQWILGNPMRRDLRSLWDRAMFTRDCRITGGPWISTGLDPIPDE